MRIFTAIRLLGRTLRAQHTDDVGGLSGKVVCLYYTEREDMRRSGSPSKR